MEEAVGQYLSELATNSQALLTGLLVGQVSLLCVCLCVSSGTLSTHPAFCIIVGEASSLNKCS